MPHLALAPIIEAAAPGVLPAAASIFGAKKNASAAEKAQAAQLAANDKALAYQKEQDAKAEARQKMIDDAAKAAWDADQARVAPLRALKERLAAKAAEQYGLPFDTSTLSAPKPYPGVTSGVQPLSALKVASTTPAGFSSVAGMTPEDPYATQGLSLAELANISKGGWRL